MKQNFFVYTWPSRIVSEKLMEQKKLRPIKFFETDNSVYTGEDCSTFAEVTG